MPGSKGLNSDVTNREPNAQAQDQDDIESPSKAKVDADVSMNTTQISRKHINSEIDGTFADRTYDDLDKSKDMSPTFNPNLHNDEHNEPSQSNESLANKINKRFLYSNQCQGQVLLPSQKKTVSCAQLISKHKFLTGTIKYI